MKRATKSSINGAIGNGASPSGREIPTEAPPVPDTTHRTTIALSRALFDEVLSLGRREGLTSMNAVVHAALEEYAERRRREAFAAAITAMARDPDVRRESDKINVLFAPGDADGLA